MTTTLTAPARPSPPQPAPLQPAPPQPAPPSPRLRWMRYEPEPGGEDEPADVHSAATPGLPLPAPPDSSLAATVLLDDDQARAAVSGVLRLAMEVLDGRRPLKQLARHFHAAPLRYWRVATQQRASTHRVRAPARIHRIVLCVPRAGVTELAAVCGIDGRVRALAARFEQTDPAAPWRCTALRLG